MIFIVVEMEFTGILNPSSPNLLIDLLLHTY